MSSVQRRMAAGIAWMSLMRLGVKGLGLISTVILARLLVPADFGLVAMAMSIVAALELLRAFNFDIALIQSQDASRSYYDTAWTFNVLFGLALSLGLVTAALPAGDFYNEPRLPQVMSVLALGVFVSGFENIGVVAFRKELDFRKEFLLGIMQKVCAACVTLPLAFALRSHWALVIGIVSGNISSVLITYYAHPFRPRFSLAQRHHLLSFSKWLLVNNMLWFIRDRSPDFLLGRISGAGALGLFTVSYEISNLPTTELVAPINRAVFPAYAKMAHDLEVLRQGFLNVLGLVTVVALPAGFGIAATSDLVVNVVLGAKWSAAVPLVSVLAIMGSLNAIQTNCGNVHYAMGRPRTMTVIFGIQVLALMPGLVWGAIEHGAIGIAWAYLLSFALVSVPMNYVVVLRRLQLPFVRLWALLWRPMLATAVMYAIVKVWTARSDDASVAALVLAIAIGAGAYASAVALMWRLAGRPAGPEATLMEKLLIPAWNRIAVARGSRAS